MTPKRKMIKYEMAYLYSIKQFLLNLSRGEIYILWLEFYSLTVCQIDLRSIPIQSP